MFRAFQVWYTGVLASVSIRTRVFWRHPLNYFYVLMTYPPTVWPSSSLLLVKDFQCHCRHPFATELIMLPLLNRGAERNGRAFTRNPITSPILRKGDTSNLIHFKHSSNSSNMSAAEILTRAIWRAADAVCFDVDSTVCMDEAIDELAKFAGKEKEVTELTLKAMRGGLTFRDALEKRLNLINPTTKMLNSYLLTHPPHLTPGVEELITELLDRDIPVYLVSGGFREIIEPIAEQLDIPRKHVFANSLKFYFNGDYAGFDENEPTSHQEGKAEVVAYLKHRYGFRRLIMIGDGATDLAACPPADAFIGFGGNQVREKVKQEAKWFVMNFQELTSELRRN